MPRARAKPKGPVQAPRPREMKLTEEERIQVLGITAREREVQRLLEPIQADAALVSRQIERRLGLPEGALGSSHQIDGDSMQVVEMGMAGLPPDFAGPSAGMNGEGDPEAVPGPEKAD